MGGTRFDPWVALVASLVGAVAVALAYVLRDVLVAAPETAFPLLFSVTIGGVFLVVWLQKRRGLAKETRDDEGKDEDA